MAILKMMAFIVLVMSSFATASFDNSNSPRFVSQRLRKEGSTRRKESSANGTARLFCLLPSHLHGTETIYVLCSSALRLGVDYQLIHSHLSAILAAHKLTKAFSGGKFVPLPNEKLSMENPWKRRFEQ